jgi:hypothetical protein
MRTSLTVFLSFVGCTSLPPALPAPQHGLEQVWIETLGLE